MQSVHMQPFTRAWQKADQHLTNCVLGARNLLTQPNARTRVAQSVPRPVLYAHAQPNQPANFSHTRVPGNRNVGSWQTKNKKFQPICHAPRAPMVTPKSSKATVYGTRLPRRSWRHKTPRARDSPTNRIATSGLGRRSVGGAAEPAGSAPAMATGD